MSRKKVSAISLYLKDLKRNESGKYLDMKTAAMKFKTLSVQDKDYYEVSAKRINEKNVAEVVFTTQKDTLGNNLKDIAEIADRRAQWENKCRKHIRSIATSDNILHKEFYAIKISGVDFCRSEDNKRVYATSEICIIKFSFMKGIIDKLILFPDIINVASGYRQHLYEDLEENVGWKPETFKNNHSIQESLIAIRNFVNGKFDDIYVPTKDHQEEVGLALQTLYDENNMTCPWIESYEDWGKKCNIYQLEYLISAVLNNICAANTSNEDASVSVVLDFWRQTKVEIAPETCERHMQYGLANQCCTNMLIKYIYGSLLMVDSPELSDIQNRVSSEFYKDMDFIIPMENNNNDNKEVSRDSDHPVKTNSNWSNYFFEKSNIEDVITSFSGITIKSDLENASNYKKQVEWGRGRGMSRRQEISAPGASATTKIKLPNVVC